MHRALTPGAHSITVDGIVQRFHVHGDGPVCVVHPGGPGMSWGHLRLPGLEESNTMVYVEPIGTGDSGRLPAPDSYTLGRYAAHLLAVVEAVGGHGAALLGHGHGGSVVQRYITTYPGSVRALVLVSATPVWNVELIRETADNLAAFAEQNARHREAADVETAYLDVLTAADDHTLTYALRRLFPAYFRDYWDSNRHASYFTLRSAVTAWAAPANRGAHESTDFRDSLTGALSPALIIAGAHDPIIGSRWSRVLEACLPGSRLAQFSGSAHMPHLEEPEKFRRTVAEFLTR